jgi:hypothetical protein
MNILEEIIGSEGRVKILKRIQELEAEAAQLRSVLAMAYRDGGDGKKLSVGSFGNPKPAFRITDIVFEAIKKNPGLNTRKLASLLNLEIEQVRTSLGTLRKANYIVNKGKRSNGAQYFPNL